MEVAGEQGAPDRVLSASSAGLAAMSSLALAACGGGGATHDPLSNVDVHPEAQVCVKPSVTSVSSNASALPAPDYGTAARFLAQVGLGATIPDVLDVVKRGYGAWLDDQLNACQSTPTVFDWAKARGFADPSYYGSDGGVDNALWARLLGAPDVVRQRMVLAWSQIFVVSANNMAAPWGQFAAMAYWDVLEAHALGNFRDLLEAVTLSPAMGLYLSMRGSRKADAGSGRQPDENYAREVLQLFTIGLSELNVDGTERLVGGQAQPTYSNADISGLAKVFTGWDLDTSGFRAGVGDKAQGPDHLRLPMAHFADRHEPGVKTFLGVTIPEGTSGPDSLKIALDTIFAHANVGPFIARRLIQQLVTSNPAPAYVARVARAFANNGQGVRGDIQAVLRAIVLDADARPDLFGEQVLTHGKLREPMLRFVHWARLFRVDSVPDPVSGLKLWKIANQAPSTALAQSPLRAPSVFNFFRPGYVPPNTAMATEGWVAPEFQITDEASVIGYVNFMHKVVGFGGFDVVPDYKTDGWLTLAADEVPSALVDRLNLLLTGGALLTGKALLDAGQSLMGVRPLDSVQLITEAVADISLDTGRRYAVESPTGAKWADGAFTRVVTATLLVLCSPDFLVQR
jgi:uncharacterized protein (DUF1800 family)